MCSSDGCLWRAEYILRYSETNLAAVERPFILFWESRHLAKLYSFLLRKNNDVYVFLFYF